MRPVLASASRTRAAMLAAAGLEVDLVPAAIDERALDAGWTAQGLGPDAIAVRLAEAKARDVAARHPGRLVIGADQTLALGLHRFSKPADMAAARRQLMALRGQVHHLHAGVAVIRDGTVLTATVTTAAMHVRAFADAFLDNYLEAMGPKVLASVGCYQVEGIGIQLFERIDGDWFTILGMPLLPLLAVLRDEGALPA
ncbi:Maf family protein [Phreatobacter sp.]|uniref:Maf family protein n=1 Tax=Phreatobacter sp. TaxID=1966341 RepID=UPI003F70295B